VSYNGKKRFIYTVLFLAALATGGCGVLCNPGEMRCDENRAQLCEWFEYGGDSGSWKNFQSCGEIGLTCYEGGAHCDGYDQYACCD
jgi:hypothetical protein